jgi:glutamine synthetase
MLAAGLEGIEKKYPLPPPIEEDIFDFSPQKRTEAGIDTLPGSLYAAIVEAEKSELLRKALGDHIYGKIIENKKIEWDGYRTHVSHYEIDKYLGIL